MSNITNWLNIKKPASFSSAHYIKKTNRTETDPKNNLENSILYQAHRDLREKFKKRTNFASYPNERWEADIADFGGKIPPSLTKMPASIKKNKHLNILVAIDIFSRSIYAIGLKTNKATEVVKGFKKLFSKAKAIPKTLETDVAGEFISKIYKDFCIKNKIIRQYSKGLNKARSSERAIRSLKRVIMAMVQTDTWPAKTSWERMPIIASESLRNRYNRTIGMSPTKLLSSKKSILDENSRQWIQSETFPLDQYKKEEKTIQKGEKIKDNGIFWGIGDLVLKPIKKTKKALKDKEYVIHYSLLPSQISNIYHDRLPRMYELRNPSNNKKEKRLYYAKELKKIKLPIRIEPKNIIDFKIIKGKLYYIMNNGKKIQA